MNITCIATTDLRSDERALEHALALGRAGHRVTLFGVLSAETEPEEDRGPIVVVRSAVAPGPASPLALGPAFTETPTGRFRHLVDIALRRTRPEVIHAFGIDVAGPAGAAAQRLGVPLVVDDDGHSDAERFARLVKRGSTGLRRFLLGRAAARRISRRQAVQRRLRRDGVALVVAPTKPYAVELESRFGGPQPLVVHDCFPSPRASDPHRLRVRLGTYPGERLVAIRGSGAPGSGADAAVRALRILGDGHVLVFVGTAPDEHVARVALECGVAGRVRHVTAPSEREVVELLGSADVAVIPHEPEGGLADLILPPAAFECLASGVPVAASDLPAVGALVRDTGAGVLYSARRPSDPGALAEAVRTLLVDRSLASICRDRALTAARSGLSWGRESQRLVGAYDQLFGVT